jgi:toxin ParE1/3/4
MRVEWLPSALADLAAITAYIEERNPPAAFELVGALLLAAERLADFPNIGRPGMANGTRELVIVSPYLLIYEVREDEIRILRVWHGARNR